MNIQIPGRGGDVWLDAYFPETGGRDRAPMPAVVICPGGGYRVVGTTEGRPVADKFNEIGYAAFILNYTVGERAVFGAGGFRDFAPMLDLKAAMRLLCERAAEYGIDAENIMLAGFSAGGHLAAAYCLSPDGAAAEGAPNSSSGGTGDSDANPAPLPKPLPRATAPFPSALILAYAAGGGPDSGGAGKPQPDFDVARMPYSDDPRVRSLPVFFWHGQDDQMVPCAVSERLDERLTREHIEHKFLLLQHSIHARPFTDPSWFPEAMNWLKKYKKSDEYFL